MLFDCFDKYSIFSNIWALRIFDYSIASNNCPSRIFEYSIVSNIKHFEYSIIRLLRIFELLEYSIIRLPRIFENSNIIRFIEYSCPSIIDSQVTFEDRNVNVRKIEKYDSG